MTNDQELQETTDQGPDRDAHVELTLSAEQTIESFQGPLPHPRILEHYEHVLPGLADRIVTMAEQRTAHRQEMERRAFELSDFDLRAASTSLTRGMLLGALLAILILAGGAYMAFLGEAEVGGTVICATIVGLAGTFV